MGPANNAGRISVVVGVPGDPYTYYVAGANGGIIKTTNAGTTFKPIFDKQDVSSIGAIAIAPSDPNVIYVGTGEGNPRNNASIGDGMYRSVDGGEHWTHIGLEKTDKIARLVIDSRNPDVVYACAIGREWGPNEDRGVFKTVDGGRTWKKVLYVDPQTACSDISADPNNSNIIYAGMYTYRRWAWHLESGGGNTAVYKSVNGGDTWEKLSGKTLERGLPKGDMDRIGVAVAPSDPNIVYVISETKSEGELWRSDDAGATWRTVNRDPNINFRPFYYADIRVDPKNPNKIFALSGALNLSEDGGTTFRTIARDVHGDHQAMWIDPLNPNRVLSGSDGGWQISYDGSKTFEVVNTFPFTQFYHINYDMQRPYMACGGLQDNGNWCGPSQTASGQGNRKADWYTVSGGDGFFTVPVMDKPWLIYSDAQGGMLNITDTRTGTQKTIYPYPNRVGSVGDAMISHKYRFNWNSPIALSPQNPKVVYFGGNVLFKSTDYGMSWTPISGDLTTNDPAKQQSSGGPIVVDNTAAEFHCTILTIAPSPLDSNVIWIGTDDGNVQVTRDGGKTWSNVFRNVPGLKPNAWIPTVEASHFDAGTAYVAADHHQDDDYAPYAYMTTDYGKTWTRITGDLPAKAAWVHVVREDPRNRNLLYLGAEMGAWASWDRGAHWVSLRGDLPVVQVRDIQIHPRENDLLLATHGRGLYILDDITALQQLDAVKATDVALFDLRAATRWTMWSRDGNLGQKAWRGENPPAGALITYYLKNQPAGEVNVTVTDKDGKVVRRIQRVPDEAGVNRIAWDLRYDPVGGAGGGGQNRAAGPTGAAPDTSLEALRARRRAATDGGSEGANDEDNPFAGARSPAVLPGTYTVAVSVGGRQYTKPLQVEHDPRSDMTPAQVLAQHDAGIQIRDLTTRVNQVVASTDDLMRQLTGLQDQLRRSSRPAGNGAGGPAAPDSGSRRVLADVDSAVRDLRHFRDSVLARPLQGLGYRQYPRLRDEVQTVSNMIWRPTMPPTAGEMLRLGELKKETDDAQARFDSIVSGRVARINQALAGTPHVITPQRPRFTP
ncbi:MAG TPA: FlgD immunoglobulin-like domain containing protein [Gemmatimonadaceae bacterium]|nr:FlgD immunoglobulin-like domain containing protein [Gemmatimonadaceae bacterium]